jgi:PHD/YefM family antitoxin component YafN of YafNO toxin-antitoxin module
MNTLTLAKTASNLPAALIAAELSPVAILENNKPAGYIISPRYLAKLESYLEDDYWSNIAREREKDAPYLGHEETMRRLENLNKAMQNAEA